VLKLRYFNEEDILGSGGNENSRKMVQINVA
jgi:hypothetical protein